MPDIVDLHLELIEYFSSKGFKSGVYGPASHLQGLPPGILLKPKYTIVGGSMTFLVTPPYVTQYILTSDDPTITWKPIKKWHCKDRKYATMLLNQVLNKGTETWKDLFKPKV